MVTLSAAARARLAAVVFTAAIVMVLSPAAPFSGLRSLVGMSRPAAANGVAATAATVVVTPGDTVWDLVAGHVPAGESRHSYVARTLESNGVEGARLRPGTVLRLPGG